MKFNHLDCHSTIDVMDKPFNVYWSKAADNELKARKHSLIVEMQLKFACMVVKHVYFHNTVEGVETKSVTDQLKVFYRPLIGKSCDISDQENGREQKQVLTEVTEGPMAKRFPKKLGLDYVNGEWIGEYV